MKKIILLIVVMINISAYAENQINNIIIPVTYYTNHAKQLKLIDQNLKKYNKVGIVGISGIGKTQLARVYSYENKGKYRVIWFIDCNLDLNTEFLKLAKAINNFENKIIIKENLEGIQNTIKEYLVNKDDWLLVFDNLKIDNRKVIEYIEWENNGKIIFCSQSSDLFSNIITLSPFRTTDAIKLAKQILDNEDSHFIEFLIKEFKGYPILIVQGAQLINNIKGLDKEEYKKQLLNSADKIEYNIQLAIKALPKTAKSLLTRMSLINNGAFSKKVLSIITEYPESLDEDIYQISKLLLISNIDENPDNPVFEMHDLIANKINSVIGREASKDHLEDIVLKIVSAVPKGVMEARIFRNTRTYTSNMEIILRNAELYEINITKLLALNMNLINQYLNSLDYSYAKQKIDWFLVNLEKDKFNLGLMSNDDKVRYAGFLALIGEYYRNGETNWCLASKYFTMARDIYKNVIGYESYKFNNFYTLSVGYLALGDTESAMQEITSMKNLFDKGGIDKKDIGFLYFANARVKFLEGDYKQSLLETNKTINSFIDKGVDKDDLILTNPYMLRSEILNMLGDYKQSLAQSQHLYNISKNSKDDSHEIFGRIYVQMANSYLGEGNINLSKEYIAKASKIFDVKLENSIRNSPEIAKFHKIQGDIFFAEGDFDNAIKQYRKSQGIYSYLYQKNINNVAQISDLYLQGAKASCEKKDLFYYKCFGKSQIEAFGIEHENSKIMLEYCGSKNMDIWSK